MIAWGPVLAALRWLAARLGGGPSARQQLAADAQAEIAVERAELASAAEHLTYYRQALDDLAHRLGLLTTRLAEAEEREIAARRHHTDCERRLADVEARAETALREVERGRGVIDRLVAQVRDLAEALSRARRLTPTSEHSAVLEPVDPVATPPAGSRLLAAAAPAGAGLGPESLTPPFGDDTPT